MLTALLIFGRQTNDDRKEQGEIDRNAKYGVVGGECLTILNDVFVPWDKDLCAENTNILAL